MDGSDHYPGGETASRPPSRRMSRRTPAVSVIVGINVLVFLAWQAAVYMPGLERFMVTNFLVSTTHLQHGYFWTLVTSAFSHSELWHMAINMFVLWSFGTVLERLWGTRVFVAFYLAAAVVSSASHCAVSSLYIGSGDIPALGASGAIAGLLLAYALHYPRHKILLFGIVPIPALAGVLAFVGLDIWGLIAQGRGGGLPIGHGAHLGGALAGAVMYFMYLRSTYPTPSATGPRSPAGTASLTVEEAHEFERIRVKIETHGPHVLTPKEQAFLDRLRERIMQAGGGPR
ncbi:MAG: rhomboid family intramembrane serine protease [Acidobacteria bacterium]|nr:rhomboid family intramembrane serine protease [Acidobacteriota bacterium]